MRPLVLIVDNEPMVRRFLVRALLGKGYDVIEAESPADALEQTLQADRPLDLAVIDLNLQGAGDGELLANDLLPLVPDLQILFITGGLVGERRAEGPVLMKPFGPAEFAMCAQEYLATGCCQHAAPGRVTVWQPSSLLLLLVVALVPALG
jgi:CheY-like chemotaxis protein